MQQSNWNVSETIYLYFCIKGYLNNINISLSLSTSLLLSWNPRHFIKILGWCHIRFRSRVLDGPASWISGDWWHAQILFFIWQPQLLCNILLLLLWIFNAKSGILLWRDLHARGLIVLYEHCTSEQLSRAFGGSTGAAFSVAIYSYAANKTRWRLTDARARHILYDEDEKWRQLISWFPD